MEQAHTRSARPAFTRSPHGNRAAFRRAAERSASRRPPGGPDRRQGFPRVADRRTGMGMESAEVVTRAMHGDHDAFAALIGPAANRLYALACLILRDAAARLRPLARVTLRGADRAEDAAQEAIVRAWRELPRLRDPHKFEAWLRRMVVNACYDEGRRIRRHAEVALVNLSDHQTADPTTHFAESERIDRAFRRLPLEQRTTLVLQHQFGMSHVEIAETLGVPVGTVKSRIRYGTTAMRAALEADDRVAAQPVVGERTA